MNAKLPHGEERNNLCTGADTITVQQTDKIANQKFNHPSLTYFFLFASPTLSLLLPLSTGIEDVKRHLEEVDNVPLLVSLYTDVTKKTTADMVSKYARCTL